MLFFVLPNVPFETMPSNLEPAAGAGPFSAERNADGTLAGGAFVLFDGACGFCTWTATRMRARTPARVRWLPYQLLAPDDFARLGTTRERCRRAVQFAGGNGRAVAGASAVNRVLELFPAGRVAVTLLRILFPLLLLERLGYALVARLRVPISAVLNTRRFALFDGERPDR